MQYCIARCYEKLSKTVNEVSRLKKNVALNVLYFIVIVIRNISFTLNCSLFLEFLEPDDRH